MHKILLWLKSMGYILNSLPQIFGFLNYIVLLKLYVLSAPFISNKATMKKNLLCVCSHTTQFIWKRIKEKSYFKHIFLPPTCTKSPFVSFFKPNVPKFVVKVLLLLWRPCDWCGLWDSMCQLWLPTECIMTSVIVHLLWPIKTFAY